MHTGLIRVPEGLALAVASALPHCRPATAHGADYASDPRLDRPPELVALAALVGAEHIMLTALSPAEAVALAARPPGVPAHALPTAVAELVCSRADGNRFFAEEIALALHDQGWLDILEEDGQCTCVLHGDLDEAARHPA